MCGRKMATQQSRREQSSNGRLALTLLFEVTAIGFRRGVLPVKPWRLQFCREDEVKAVTLADSSPIAVDVLVSFAHSSKRCVDRQQCACRL